MKKLRQQSALERLQAQLERGDKPEKSEGKTTGIMVPLTERDRLRIKNEITVLTKRI